MYDEYINASKGKVPAKGKGKQGEGKASEKVVSLNGAQHVKNIGSQAGAHKDTVVQSIIQGGRQADVQSVALPVTILLNAHVQ